MSMLNAPLLRAMVRRIQEDPALWGQDDWVRDTPCGTVMCCASHLAAASGARFCMEPQAWPALSPYVHGEAGPEDVATYAQRVAGLSNGQAGLLFFDLDEDIVALAYAVEEIIADQRSPAAIRDDIRDWYRLPGGSDRQAARLVYRAEARARERAGARLLAREDSREVISDFKKDLAEIRAQAERGELGPIDR